MEKEIITNAEIEKDIIHAIKHPAYTHRATYFLWFAVWFVVSGVFVYLEIILGKAGFIAPLTVLILILLLPAVNILKKERKIKNFSFENYVIKKSVVKRLKHERYVMLYRYVITVRHNYDILFEKGKVWHIPKELYWWSETNPLTDISLYEKTAQGDVFYTVCEKKSGKIVMAYNTKTFEYEA